MNIFEVVFGDSCLFTMKNSDINTEENILMFNTLFNIANLSNVDEYKVSIPKGIYNENNNYDFSDKVKLLNEAVDKGMTIRIWCSRKDIYSYLMMLFVCNIVKDRTNIIVLYSDEFHEGCYSPACMNENELMCLTYLEHNLSLKKLKKYNQLWNRIVKENTSLRVMDNRTVKSVEIDYFDKFILNKLKSFGNIKMVHLVASLMSEVYLHDTLYVYLIDRLIEDGKIVVIQRSEERDFDNLIGISI